MSDNDELLEPFRPRIEPDSHAMFRRGSVIVIPSLDDSEDGLLEKFQPRHTSVDTANVPFLCNGDFESTTPEQLSQVINEGAKPLKQGGTTLVQLWQSLPSMKWRSSTPLGDTSNDSSASTIEELNVKKLELLAQAVKETEEFRNLKQEMISSGNFTTAGAHHARILQSGSRTPPYSPKRQPRRRSNSFPRIASKSNLSVSKHDKSAQPSSTANLSPFATNLDHD
jgi:hypothetical protein